MMPLRVVEEAIRGYDRGESDKRVDRSLPPTVRSVCRLSNPSWWEGPGILSKVSNCSDKGIPNNMQAMKTWRMSCYIATYSEQLASKAGLCMMIIFKERAVRLFHLDRHLHSPIFCLPANLFTFLAHFPRLPSFLTCSLAVRNMIRLGPKNKTPSREIGFDEICCPVSSTHKIYF